MPRLFGPLMSVLLTLVVVVPLAVRAQDSTPAPDGASTTAAPDRTDARIFVPFSSDGLNSTLSVAGNVTGTCALGSLLSSNRDDAWECTGTDDRIYDPCFENSFASADQPGELACVTSPFAQEVVLLTPDGPLNRQKESPVLAPGEAHLGAWELPWAVELANGEQCLLLSDVAAVIASESVYYDCAGGGAILGDLNREHPLWTVSYLADGAVGTELTSVAVAWN
jgi:hypothetical protein